MAGGQELIGGLGKFYSAGFTFVGLSQLDTASSVFPRFGFSAGGFWVNIAMEDIPLEWMYLIREMAWSAMTRMGLSENFPPQ
jgi:hypothetical protein